MDENRTPEEIRMEMFKDLCEKNGTKGNEHLCEVAMPGVIRPVNEDEIGTNK